jgi:integrase
MRSGEARAVCCSDLHLDGDAPHIRLENHKTRWITNKPRLIGLDPGTARFFRRLRDRAEARNLLGIEDPHVFPNCDGRPWTACGLARHFRRWADRLGLDDDVQQRSSAVDDGPGPQASLRAHPPRLPGRA